MSVKRYGPTMYERQVDGDPELTIYAGMVQDTDRGEYVLASDYDSLTARCARYENALTRISCEAGFKGWAWTVKTASDALDAKPSDADEVRP